MSTKLLKLDAFAIVQIQGGSQDDDNNFTCVQNNAFWTVEWFLDDGDTQFNASLDTEITTGDFIEEDNFINERGKILHNGVVSINLILNKQFDIIKFQISDKGFPFSYNKEAIQDEIKDILLNKILFIKEEIDENSLSGLVEEVSRKTYNRNFSLKPELLIHISLI